MAELHQCPQCRGYNLERQWCDLCNGAGMIRNEASRAPTVADIRTFADVLHDAAMKASKGGLSPGLSQRDSAALSNVDELVPPPARGADEVDAEAVDSRLNGVEGNVGAAANADPHGGLRSGGAAIHHSQQGAELQGGIDTAWSASKGGE